jgi:CRP-like cAMP-binding protein/cytochrome P450
VLNNESACPITRKGLFGPFASEVGLAVFDAEGDHHQRARAIIRLPYSRQISAQFFPEMQQAVGDVTATWREGETVDLFNECARMALFSAMAVISPVPMRQFEQSFTRAGDRVMFVQFQVYPGAALWSPLYIHARRKMWRCVDEAISRHRSGEFAGGAKTYMIDACLQATNTQGDKMDQATIRGVCLYATAGAQIYIGRLIFFLVYELLRNRAFLKHVLEEIDSMPPGVDPASALRRMPHLRAAYLETLRCYPLIPATLFKMASDGELLGHALSKDESLLFAPYLEHFSEAQHDNPTAFEPRRHLGGNAGERAGFMAPFGVGKHACAAPGMVETQVLAQVTTLLRTMDLALEHPTLRFDLRLAPLLRPTEKVLVRVVGRRAPPAPGAGRFHLAESANFDRSHEDAKAHELTEKQPDSLAAGTWLIKEGDKADAFFVLLEGQVSVWENTPGGQPTRLKTLDAGVCFGEIGLLKKVPRTSSVKCESACKVLRFSAAEFEHLVNTSDLTADDLRSLYYGRYIKGVLRSSLSAMGEAFAPESMRWQSFAVGDTVFKQGAEADAFYVIVEGEALVQFETEAGPRVINKLAAGDFFGEIGIMKSLPRSASVRAGTPLKTLRIERAVFLATVAENPNALSELALTVCQRLLRQVRQEN